MHFFLLNSLIDFEIHISSNPLTAKVLTISLFSLLSIYSIHTLASRKNTHEEFGSNVRFEQMPFYCQLF